MLDLFAKIFGPQRGVSLYVFFQRRGLAILAVFAFAGLVAWLVLFTGPPSHSHVGFMTADVVQTLPVSQTEKNGIIADLRLPDGEIVRVTTTEGQVAATVTNTACVEKRQWEDSGEFRYRMKLPHHCAGG